MELKSLDMSPEIRNAVQCDTYYPPKILIPTLCPHCKVSNNPITELIGSKKVSSYIIYAYTHKCTSCQNYHFTVQKYSWHIPGYFKALDAHMLMIYPETSYTKFDEVISKTSEKFIDIYQQAELAESHNCYELAGMGYRAALEVLIKDYALNVLHDNKQYIEQLTLNDAIGHYFKGKDYEINNITANIVRINGNNFVHWDKPEDFNSKKALDTLKEYFNIFLEVITAKIKTKNITNKYDKNSHTL